jgi:hypothetical protein
MFLSCGGGKSMKDQLYFQGEERLEIFEPVGKLMRMGCSQDLLIPDRNWIKDSFKEDVPQVKKKLELLHENQIELIKGYSEWCLHFPSTLLEILPEADERMITDLACSHWKNEVKSLELDAIFMSSENSREIVSSLSEIFVSEHIRPEGSRYGASADFEEDGWYGKIKFPIVERFNRLLLALEDKEEEFEDFFDLYFSYVRITHDALMQYTSSYPVIVDKVLGQEVAEKVVEKSFSSCSFHEGLFDLAVSLTPGALAQFFSEHLRSHFSGIARGGSTKITEEKDFYRLTFSPCGSGGAMRLRQKKNGRESEVFSGASARTWFRENEVPPYCTHCAINELTFMKKVGYPVVVTDFDPDPDKACAWIIYKDPSRIPEKYFKRIGCVRDPEKFVRSFKSRDAMK